MRFGIFLLVASISTGFIASNSFAQSWEEVEVAGLEKPTIAFQLGGRDILRLSCQNGALRVSLIDRWATPRRNSDGFEVKQILLEVGGVPSPPADLNTDIEGMGFADFTDAGQFFQSVRSAKTSGGWLWIKEAGGHWGAGPISLHDGLSDHLAALENTCGSTVTAEQSPGVSSEVPGSERSFEQRHLAEAEKHIVKLDCQNPENTPFCTNPELSPLLEELPEAAAAAIARMSDDLEMTPNFYGYNSETIKQYSACGADIPCLADVMKERIGVWDSLFTPFTSEELLALPAPGPGYDCATAIHPAQKAICASEELSQRHREMLNLIDGLIQKTEGTAIAERTKQQIDRRNFAGSKFRTYHVSQGIRPLIQVYDSHLDSLRGDFARRVEAELQRLHEKEEHTRLAEEQQLREEQERLAEQQAAAAEEIRIADQNTAWEAEQEIRRAAQRRQHMTDQPPRTIDVSDQIVESEIVLLLPPANPNTFSGASGFFEEDYKTKLFNRQGKEAVRRLKGKDVTRALHSDTAIDPILALFDPTKFNSQQSRNVWMSELYNHWRSGDSELFDLELDQALSAVGAVLECTYDRYFHPDIPGNNSNSWTTPKLLFWGVDVPESLSSSALKQRETTNAIPHPLLMVGPKVANCPATLGKGIELIAGQLGEMLDPALRPAALSGAKPEGPVTSMTDPRQQLIRDLLGMSVIETASNSEGVLAGYRNLEIDHIAPDGPAFAAGFRSGDYLWHLGWNESTTVAQLAAELEKREFETAIILTRIYGDGIDDADARLIIFDTEPETEFGYIPRIDGTKEKSKHGLFKFAEDEYSVGMWLPNGQWCAEQVVGELQYPIDLSHQGTFPVSTGVLQALETMRQSCPQLRTVRFVFRSTLVDGPIETWVFDISGTQPKHRREGLDGLPHADSISKARRIAQEHAPLCDKLTAHPADRMRRYGLQGSEFILPQDLERAIDACISELELRPNDPVLSFQLARALYEAGLVEEAFGYFEFAAAQNHAGAADYLGQMYLSGEGIAQDYELSDAYFAQAEAAGFNPFAEDTDKPFDASGTALPIELTSVYKMSARINPDYLDQGRAVDYERGIPEFLYFMLESFAEFCSDPRTLSQLRTRLSENPDDPALRHAVHIYGTHLPTLLPTLKSKVGTQKTLLDWGSAYDSASTLEGRYPCESKELRQFVMNSADLIMR